MVPTRFLYFAWWCWINIPIANNKSFLQFSPYTFLRPVSSTLWLYDYEVLLRKAFAKCDCSSWDCNFEDLLSSPVTRWICVTLFFVNAGLAAAWHLRLYSDCGEFKTRPRFLPSLSICYLSDWVVRHDLGLLCTVEYGYNKSDMSKMGFTRQTVIELWRQWIHYLFVWMIS